jgi:hypothetical protein
MIDSLIQTWKKTHENFNPTSIQEPTVVLHKQSTHTYQSPWHPRVRQNATD